MRIRKRFLLSTDPPIHPNNSTTSNLEEPNLNKELGINQEEVMMKQHDIPPENNFTNHFRKEAILVEQPVHGDNEASSHQQHDRWGDMDKVIPLKKRRGNFDQIVVNSSTHDDDEYDNKPVMTKKLKPKKNRTSKVESSSSMNSRKIKRGNVIMEGSRCSRVNGRGWRCFQQTLVGYSLCQHHLGKGRIIKSVMTISVDESVKDGTILSESDHETRQGKEDNYDDNHDVFGKMKKRMVKLGKVKARSMSSLLGKTKLVDQAMIKY